MAGCRCQDTPHCGLAFDPGGGVNYGGAVNSGSFRQSRLYQPDHVAELSLRDYLGADVR